MPLVLRWGRSAYETDRALARERAGAAELGLDWALVEDTDPPAELARAAALVIPSRVRVDAEVADRFGGDLVVATTSGHDHVDLEACRARGIAVVRSPEPRRDPVVEHALGAALFLLRRMPALSRRAREGRWARGELPALAPKVVRGAPVAVVGCGVIGARMIELLDALGAEVLGVDPAGVPAPAREVSLAEALDRAVVLTLHCSLTPSSRGLIGPAELDRLAADAVVVNTARGEVLDVEAAVQRVREGRLRGLAADVFPVEPYPRLAEGSAADGVLFTPHAAGYAPDLGERVAASVVRALGAWRAGDELPHRLA